MIYGELVKLNDGKGIFYYLRANNALPFSEDVASVSECDGAFSYNHGLKNLNANLIDILDRGESPEYVFSTVANVLKLLCSKKWDRLYKEFLIETPLNQKEVTNTKQNKQTQVTNNDTITVDNKVSAFDSSDLVDDKSEQTTNTNNDNTVNNNETTTTVSSNDVYWENIERLQDVIIYDIIFTDIKNKLFNHIY